MAEAEVACQISCQKCGWNTWATILADETNAFEDVLGFIKGCSPQHSSPGLSGELLVVWGPLELESL